MEAVKELIEIGFDFKIMPTGKINFEYRRTDDPPEEKVIPLFDTIQAHRQEAVSFILSLTPKSTENNAVDTLKEWLKKHYAIRLYNGALAITSDQEQEQENEIAHEIGKSPEALELVKGIVLLYIHYRKPGNDWIFNIYANIYDDQTNSHKKKPIKEISASDPDTCFDYLKTNFLLNPRYKLYSKQDLKELHTMSFILYDTGTEAVDIGELLTPSDPEYFKCPWR